MEMEYLGMIVLTGIVYHVAKYWVFSATPVSTDNRKSRRLRKKKEYTPIEYPPMTEEDYAIADLIPE